jgi:Arc/MetJ-type ribon-helix-helix transcriptional regulator
VAESAIVSFRATQAAQEMIDRIVATGLASSRSDAINLALEAASEGLAARLAREAEALRTKAALLTGASPVRTTPSVEIGPEAALIAPTPTPKSATDMVTETFLRIMQPSRTRPFGSLGLGLMGVSDDVQGVQWNCWAEFEGMSAVLGSNLEGIRYSNWPITDYIQRELKDPQLFDVIGELRSPKDIVMYWWCDAWQAAGRLPRFDGQDLAQENLGSLTKARYREILNKALGCLDAKRDYRGRGTRVIRLKDGRRVERAVSPHFQFRAELWTGSPTTAERDRMMAAARELLEPIHKFMVARTSG